MAKRKPVEELKVVTADGYEIEGTAFVERDVPILHLFINLPGEEGETISLDLNAEDVGNFCQFAEDCRAALMQALIDGNRKAVAG